MKSARLCLRARAGSKAQCHLGGMHGTLDVFKLDERNYLNLSCTVDLLSADWQPMVRGLADAAEPLTTFSLNSI